MLQPPALSAKDLLYEDQINDEESAGEEEDCEQPGKGFSMTDIQQVVKVGGQLCHLLEQDDLRNNEALCVGISQAISSYKDQYHAHVNSLKQCMISEFLARCQAQPDNLEDLQPGPSGVITRPDPTEDSDDLFTPSASDDEDFEGFLSALVKHMGDKE
ncbi:hypothetical protein Pcinc_022829 [Petrolisthes cinctipes]|uniref:Uncharacterized protein n=1 Tax=Petrolisthes cinctipes TaxID=88211 RepID=A0AAE1FDV2_PETCI|nr:hypothetical protein Pcinc_022829 [Petrolisthes cinctipes]